METPLNEKIVAFFTTFKYQKYKKGEILVRADDDPVGVFYLKEGMVKEYAISKKGAELVVNIFKPQAFFPMSWAMNNTPNAYYFEAMTDLVVWRAPKEKVIEFLKSEPDVLYDLLSRVYKGTDGLLTRMTYLMAGNAYGRLATELLIQAKRFGMPQTEPPSSKQEATKIFLPILETDLAAASGMTRETVSREMKTLKDKGIVTLQKNMLVINDLVKLEKEIAS